jgi:hypothetical protein
MGDLHGVFIGEEAHLNILKEKGVLRDDEIIELGSPFPGTDTVAGVYIDDLGVVQKLTKSDFDSNIKMRDQEIMEHADVVCTEEGLLEKAEKRQRNMASGQVWGASLGGDSPVAAVALNKRHELSRISLGVIASRSLDRKSAQRLWGHWGFPLQFRRAMWCIFGESYKWIESLAETGSFRVPGKVLDELLAMAVLSPLIRTPLRTPLLPLIGATDASTDGIGGCEAPVSNELAGALFRKSDIRGERVSLQNVLHKDPGRDRPFRKKDTIAPTIVRRMLIAIHAFSGARRVEDVHFFWVRLGWSRGYDVKVLDFDLAIASNHDFMNDGFF